MSHVLPPPPVPTLAVLGSDARFPVRRIYCVGRNYDAHTREMGGDTREPPFFFAKPADALVVGDRAIAWPRATQNLHHEAELVIAIGGRGADLDRAAAEALIWGYAPGNDLTRRDLQDAAKAMRRPWDMSKGFDDSAPCGTLVPVAECGHPVSGAIRCTVDGALRQQGDLAEMIWDAAEIVAHLSQLVLLCPGDLIFTGTPAGVGPVLPGQTVRVEIDGLGAVETRIG